MIDVQKVNKIMESMMEDINHPLTYANKILNIGAGLKYIGMTGPAESRYEATGFTEFEAKTLSNVMAEAASMTALVSQRVQQAMDELHSLMKGAEASREIAVANMMDDCLDKLEKRGEVSSFEFNYSPATGDTHVEAYLTSKRSLE